MNFWALGKNIYNMSNPREVRRCITFCVRAFFHRSQMVNLHQFFQQSPLLQQVAEAYPFVYEQPTRAFFYHRSDFQERIALMKGHMSFLAAHIRKEYVLALYQAKPIPLWSGMKCVEQQFSASLFFEPGQRKEGLLSIVLWLGDMPFYQIIFWINTAHDGTPAMWIGAMQGPNMTHARDMVKLVTKACHGCRTKNMAVYIAQIIARRLRLHHIYAVTNEGYYANNHLRIDRKLKTDFSEFWQESGGWRTTDARFMELPLTEKRKAMEEVPTRKRAVYRRRFAMLDEIDGEITEVLDKIVY